MSVAARRELVLSIVVTVAVTAVGATWWLVPPARADALRSIDLVALAVAAYFGERLSLPRDTGRAPTMAIAVVAAAAMLGWSPLVTAELGAVAWLSQVRRVRKSGSASTLRLGHLVSRVLSGWGLAGIVAAAASLAPATWAISYRETGQRWALPIAGVAVMWLIIVLGLPLIEAIESSLRAGPERRLRYLDVLRASWQGDAVLVSSATLGALAFPVLGVPTLVLMALPLLGAKVGLDGYVEIRRTYSQTLRAMSRLPEQLGAVDPDHGVRAGEIAARAAIELGYGARVVADIERAAQLHELGRIKTERGIELTPAEVAQSGAAIVLEAGGLERVAAIIAAHRRHAAVGDSVAWVGGALVRLACELDLRMGAGGDLSVIDEAWLRNQGVEPHIARALIVGARARQLRLV